MLSAIYAESPYADCRGARFCTAQGAKASMAKELLLAFYQKKKIEFE
jgi:hypothetical protein